MKKFSDKFNELGGIYAVEKERGFLPMTEEEIRELEGVIGNPLPSDYRAFLQFYGRAVFGKLTSFPCIEPPPSSGPNNRQPLDLFYGSDREPFQSLSKSIGRYRGRMAPTMIPIASNMFGDQICLGVAGSEREKVYFWDHDDERDEGDFRAVYGNDKPIPHDWWFQNTYLIANSFEEFILALEVSS